jgi:hypothetical protein
MRYLALPVLLLASASCARTGVDVQDVEATSLRPAFRWQAFPGRDADDPAYRRATSVTYDLRIFREDGPGSPVVDLKGLPKPEHRLEQDLEPDTEYRWTVRARFELDGKPRIGAWSRSYWGLDASRSVVIPESLGPFASFHTPPVAKR